MNRPGISSRAGGLLVSSLPRGAFAALAAAALLSGCANYKGGKIVEGTDIAAGMSIPQSGGTLQIDALNFLTGFRFLFCDNAGVKCEYTTTNSVSAFGVYSSTTVKHIEIELTPTVDEAAEGPAQETETTGTDAAAADSAQKAEECADGSCTTGACTDGNCSP